jgi:hypothetical protein
MLDASKIAPPPILMVDGTRTSIAIPFLLSLLCGNKIGMGEVGVSRVVLMVPVFSPCFLY